MVLHFLVPSVVLCVWFYLNTCDHDGFVCMVLPLIHDLDHAAGTSINFAFCEEIINSDIPFIMVVYEIIFYIRESRYIGSFPLYPKMALKLTDFPTAVCTAEICEYLSHPKV